MVAQSDEFNGMESTQIIKNNIKWFNLISMIKQKTHSEMFCFSHYHFSCSMCGVLSLIKLNEINNPNNYCLTSSFVDNNGIIRFINFKCESCNCIYVSIDKLINSIPQNQISNDLYDELDRLLNEF